MLFLGKGMEIFYRIHSSNNCSKVFFFKEKGKQHSAEIEAVLYIKPASILIKLRTFRFHLWWDKNSHFFLKEKK